MGITANSYTLDASSVREPPANLRGVAGYLGPSLILTASVVGSGELIMTTALGAKAGYVALWVVLLSCLLKVFVQLEFGKHAICTGETSLEAFNRLPGPNWRGTGWAVWFWLTIKTIQLVQYAGIAGGVALALHLGVPSVPVWVWAWVAGLGAAVMVAKGSYRAIERWAVLLTAAFTLFTVACVVALQGTTYRISAGDLLEGMSFRLPAGAAGVAIAVFGATGISADEIISYPYWCLEKGYARFTGAPAQTADWRHRARGWIRVMYVDAVLSLLVYTLATTAFYVLGAAILHGRGEIPAGYEMIRALSRIYTESFGEWAIVAFIAGSAVVLFSTLFVACASATRMFTDAFAQCGLLSFGDAARRDRWISGLAWLLPVLWVTLFLASGEPLVMILAGGVAVALLLIIVVFAAFYFRYRRLDKRLRPGPVYDAMLWLSGLAIAGVALKAAANL